VWHTMKKYHLPGFVAVIAIIAQSLHQYVGVSMRRSRSGQIWTKAIRDRGTRKCPPQIHPRNSSRGPPQTRHLGAFAAAFWLVV
jgi:hypothetical protein